MKGLKTEEKSAPAPLEKDLKVTSALSKKQLGKIKKDFTLEALANLQKDRIYGKGNKSDVFDENLISLTNKMSKKLMVSAATSWLQHHNQTFFCK